MTEREKIIKGLECRLDINGSKYKHCLTCNYRHDIDHCQWACQTDGILEDALALLKAQEPRILTKGEYKALAEKPKEERDPVWEEWPGVESTWAIPEQAYDGYGTSWWAWTSRPTEEQMKAVKWE